MNKRLKKAVERLFAFVICLYIAKEIALNLMCEVSFNIRTHLNPYRLVRKLNRLSIERFISGESFESFATEVVSDFPRLQDYKYSTEIIDNAIFNQAFETSSRRDKCVKQAAPLLSLFFNKEETPRFTVIGAVFFSNLQTSRTYQDVICQSQTTGWQELNKPYLKDGEAICGEGTSEFIIN